MPHCPTCGKQLESNVRYCPEDGTPLKDTGSAIAGMPQTDTGPGGDSTRQARREAESKSPLVLPLVLGGRYRLEEFLGGGGMAKVYRATDLTLERVVAVKRINPELRDEEEFDSRFQREARIASQLADPHIVVVHDFGLDAEHGPYLVMEYLQGQTLRERLEAGPMTYKAGLQLGAQLMLALIHAHGKGIVHRDLKPDNIFLLNQSGMRLHLRVLDFGVASILRGEEPAESRSLTQPGVVLGTPRYMSPEQLAGKAVDTRSDLYSAALVIFEAFTNQMPYVSGKRLTELCPEASPVLERLLEQCLKQNPDERPAGAADIYLQLQELGKASGILLVPKKTLDRLVASNAAEAAATVDYVPPRRRRWGVVLMLLAVMLAGAGAWYLWSDGGPFGRSTLDGPETLLGARIGDLRGVVSAKIGDSQKGQVGDRTWQGQTLDNPWVAREGELLHVLGLVLRPGDVGANVAGAKFEVHVLHPDERVCQIFFDRVLCALVVRSGYEAATGRGLRMGDNFETLQRLYPQAVRVAIVPIGAKANQPGPPGEVEVWRDDVRGIGFEVRNDRVQGITLYPPQGRAR